MWDEESNPEFDELFDIWNRFEKRLPVMLYQRKLLEMGDFLVSIKEFNLALWQCYGRYLNSFGDVNVEEITSVEVFKKEYFPEGFETEDAGFTFRALMGRSICTYEVIRTTDSKLQNRESVLRSLRLLSFLRLVMQVILPKENLCWLVYNGTIHIYSICRHMMSVGHSADVIEFLLWASMCMEASVTLLGVRYLVWRSTLYTAVCQCYYDCRADQNAESFARRGLQKIDDLSRLEFLSNDPPKKETEISFRTATIKMAVMIFKRAAFEGRKRPKGLLRPKTRTNLKEAATASWPRTMTERLLVDMFEGSSAQMLAIVETLTDSGRRTLLTAPPAPESQGEVLDVFAELFMAASEIIAGGGGMAKEPATKKDPVVPKTNLLKGVVHELPLSQMAASGDDGVPLSVVIKVVKLAYCYEQWDVYDALSEATVTAIRELSNAQFAVDRKALEIMQAYDKVTRMKHKKQNRTQTALVDREQDISPDGATAQLVTHSARKSPTMLHDDLINLAEALLSVTNGPYTQETMDLDMMVDACLFLWNKCKSVFLKYQTGSADNAKYLQKMDNPSKWVYILDIVHQVLAWCGLNAVDPALTAEVVLRLALVFEASACLDTTADRQSKASLNDDGEATSDDDSEETESEASVQSSVVQRQCEREQLVQAREILELGLANVSYARHAVACADTLSVADIVWNKELNPEMFKPGVANSSISMRVQSNATTVDQPAGEDEDEDGERAVGEGGRMKSEVMNSGQQGTTAVWNLVKDLHLELLFMYHRVCLKLAALPCPGAAVKNPDDIIVKQSLPSAQQYTSVGSLADTFCETFDDLAERCRKDRISRAMLYMQQALLTSHQTSTERHNLLQEALSLIRKAEMEERRVYMDNVVAVEKMVGERVVPCRVPPPPILLSRTDTSMVFRPAAFVPESGEKIAWYRIFGRTSTGNNVRVRLNDYFLEGCGQQVPSFECLLNVSGMVRGERYVFGVAAYTAQGDLIGGGVGETGRAILASHPNPLLIAWAYLCQLAHQVNVQAVALEACSVLWGHFVAPPAPPTESTYVTSASRDFKLTLLRLNRPIVYQTSPVLLRMFLNSIFIYVEINTQQGSLFCDSLSDNGPLTKSQIHRLQLCERLLVAMQLSGWLNEGGLALQSVVQCYSLLAPLIHFHIPCVPVVQVLERCSVVLQEIPSGLRQKRTAVTTESLHHMTACLTYHTAKVLRSWGERSLATSLSEAGRQLLSVASQAIADSDAGSSVAGEQAQAAAAASLASLKHQKKKGKKTREDDHGGNEELRALEAHMAKLYKQTQAEHELIGNEDPAILNAYITFLPSKVAYKEVIKFKKRAQFLEFFVRVAEKGLWEGLEENVQEWCADTLHIVNKRNDGIIGIHRSAMNKQIGAMTVIGDDPRVYAAALVEYSKVQGPLVSARSNQQFIDDNVSSIQTEKTKDSKVTKPVKKKRTKYKAIGITATMTSEQKQMQEELEFKAMDIISLYLLDLYHMRNKFRRLRKVIIKEMPWRVQLNIIQASAAFEMFLQRVHSDETAVDPTDSFVYSTSFLDQEWFSMQAASTLVVGWDGGPSYYHTSKVKKTTRSRLQEIKKAQEKAKTSGIAMAANALTIGVMFGDVEDRPKKMGFMTGVSKASRPPRRTADSSELMELLRTSLRHCQRAVILAHRARRWTLLQNACATLWNCAWTSRSQALTPQAPLCPPSTLYGMLWKPLAFAADCLLDMFLILQKEDDMFSEKSKVTGVRAWLGTPEDEMGGTDVTYDGQLDERSRFDVHFVRRLVLNCLEVLFHQDKWEWLVHIGYRFNAVTHCRYAEQVNPLIVHAQRKLIAKIADNLGRPAPQLHYQEQMSNGQPISYKQYTQLQLRIDLREEELSRIDPGAQIDPEGHNAYSGGIHALRLCSVPLDVDYNLKRLREVAKIVPYFSRMLRHSRQLLMLYLAGQTNSPVSTTSSAYTVDSSDSRVGFQRFTAQPLVTAPRDLSHEQFLILNDVQMAPLPKSQIHIVIESYHKTIEMLGSGEQNGLKAEALAELGTVYYHTGRIRNCYKVWCECLDVLLGLDDVLHNWHTLKSADQEFSSRLLETTGIWGCLLAAVVMSNIAQYIQTSDLAMRTECCLFSAYLFKALLRASLPHPSADRDYALYEIGVGCEVVTLIPGIDIFSDKFRCDGRSVLSAVRFVTEDLIRSRHYLFVQPVLTFQQFVASSVCRDVATSVSTRLQRVASLTDAVLLSDATVHLLRLMQGERLPLAFHVGVRQLDVKVTTAQFSTASCVLDPGNIRLLEMLMLKRLPPQLSSLYGSHFTCHIALAQAHLLIAIAQTIPALPAFTGTQPGTNFTIDVDKRLTMSEGSSVRIMPAARGGVLKVQLEEGADSKGRPRSEYSRSTKETASLNTTLPLMKGSLLVAADNILSTLNHNILDTVLNDGNIDALSCAELELVVRCRLDLAAIACQQHHSSMAAHLIQATIRLLQDSNIFAASPVIATISRTSAMKKDKNELGDFQLMLPSTRQPEAPVLRLIDVQSHARLNTRLWLHCRLALVRSMTTEIRGMGHVKGSERSVKTQLAEVHEYCEAGAAEAEASGELEMHAEFLLQRVMLNLMEGEPLSNTKALLQTILNDLGKIRLLSSAAQLMKVQVHLLLTDLEAAVPSDHLKEGTLLVEYTKEKYLAAQEMLLTQLEGFGEQIERRYDGESAFSAPVSSLRNVYLPHMLCLVQTKLRLGHAMGRRVAANVDDRTDEELVAAWTAPLGVLTTALHLCEVIAQRIPSIEAELLLNIGKVERQLYHLGSYHQRVVAQTLYNAINTSVNHEHDLGLIRQAYLEMALVFMASSQLESSGTSSATGSVVDLSDRRKRRVSRLDITAAQKADTSPEVCAEVEQRAACVAVRCAAGAAAALRARTLLNAHPTTQDANHSPAVPEFLALDLVSSYVIGEKKRVFNNVIEEEMAPLLESLEPSLVETYADQVEKAKDATKDLSWIHIVGYQSIIQRLCCLSTLATDGSDTADPSPPACCRPQRHDAVDGSLLGAEWSVRLASLHRFLSDELSPYAAQCSVGLPPSSLLLPPPHSAPGAAALGASISSFSNRVEAGCVEGASQPASGVGRRGSMVGVAPPTLALAVMDNELCLQWYQPSLQRAADGDTVSDADSDVILLYVTLKRPDMVHSRRLAVSHDKLIQLHDRLILLLQRAELSLSDQLKKETSSTTRMRRPPRIKALSSEHDKTKPDEQIELLFSQCLADCQTLLGRAPAVQVVESAVDLDTGTQLSDDQSLPRVTSPSKRPPPQVPFEMKKANIQMFEQMFDPSFGFCLKQVKMLSWFTQLLK